MCFLKSSKSIYQLQSEDYLVKEVVNMKIIKLADLPIAETAHKVHIKKMFAFEHATIVYIELQKDESLKMHKTPVDALFYILEGTGVVEIGEEIQEVTTNQLVFSPAKIKHRLFNKKEKVFRFLVIKVPTPTTQTKML